MRTPYPTDLTDAEWDIVRAFIPEAVTFPNLEEPKYSRRDIMDAIFYRERTGCQWRNLPHEFPPWKQVFEYFRKWRDKGIISALHDALRGRVRQLVPHADGTPRAESPTAFVVDTLGLLLALQVTSASVQDRDGALPILKEASLQFPTLQVVFMDGAYRGEIKARIEKETGIEVKITLRSDAQKRDSSQRLRRVKVTSSFV